MINNAERRIDESKFDDTVARLYRAMELISQIGLLNKKLFDENRLKNKTFIVNEDKLDEIDDLDIKNRLDTRSGLRNNFTVLEKLGVDYAKEYMQNKEIQNRIQKRNESILAHGLNPIDKGDAKMLHDLVLDYAHKLYPKIEEYKDIAEFPKFNIDS